MGRQAEVRRALAVLAVGGSLLATACASSDAGVAAARRESIATAPEATTTTDPYALPAVIDVAYVNRVLAGLDAAVGDVVRFVVANHPPPHDIAVRLKPLYNNTALADQLEFFRQDAEEDYKGYQPVPGNERSDTVEVITSGSRCLFARVMRDYTPVSSNTPAGLSEQWVGLVPLDPTRDPDHVNPTGWTYIYDGFERGHVAPRNPCDAQP